MKGELEHIVQKLLKKTGISLDTKEFIFQIQSHPSYPSLKHTQKKILSFY